jgi:hypothetical protein
VILVLLAEILVLLEEIVVKLNNNRNQVMKSCGGDGGDTFAAQAWGGGAQILYESKGDDSIFVEADRHRVAQLVAAI